MIGDLDITFADNVRILASPETDARGLAGKTGQVMGMTTPSITKIEVIGGTMDDSAMAVTVEGMDGELWISPDLLQWIDHAEGTEITIGNQSLVRQADGSWDEGEGAPPKKWWRFW